MLLTAVCASAQSPFEGVTWARLDSAFEAAAASGFSGVVLARRDGHVVLQRAYGVADRETGRAMTLDAVFDIGSTPVNFTMTALSLLEREGKLRLDDSLSAWLPDVPAEKRGITLRHLVTWRAGIADFVHTGADWDPDLAWIDRPEFERRALAAPLTHPPGGGPAPSHGAMGLLAAIVERASGMSYQQFVRQRILEPSGMRETGFYGETLGLPRERFAVGEGAAVGLPNIPPNWGPTSWLVMGSGGMFSTVGDLDRYFRPVATGTLPARPGASGGRALSLGGTDRGFLAMYLAYGRGSSILTLESSNRQPAQGRTRIDALRALLGL
jgi:CubicO group peptidase (beta-lactamase class C family)